MFEIIINVYIIVVLLLIRYWCKHVWETTLKQYKACLKDWFKGTGGGSGLASEFETWDEEKFEKYGIELESYDHMDIKSRPSILMHLYTKQREPYVTFIHVWDEKSQGLLSSKYEKLIVVHNEPGVSSPQNSNTPSNVNVSTTSTSSIKKRKAMDSSANELGEVMNKFMKFCGVKKEKMSGVASKLKKRDKNDKGNDQRLEELSLNELYTLNDQH